MRVLVDTCVISELKRPNADPRVIGRLESIAEDDLFLSVVTIGELENGISRLAKGKKRTELDAWLRQIEQLYDDRILPIDVETARIWGSFTAQAAKRGQSIPAADGLIAATAIRHGLHVMTRNTSDFKASAALLIDPWADPA